MTRTPRSAAMAVTLLLLLPLALVSAGATPVAAQEQGTVITVDATHDDSPTNTLPDGDCTLREAIFAANNDVEVDACPAGNGNDTILLARDETYLLDFNSPRFEEDENRRGDLDIYQLPFVPGEEGFSAPAAAFSPDEFALTIHGNDSVVDGSGLEHCNVFHILGVPVLITELTIQGGGNFPALEENEFTTEVPQGGGVLVEGDPGMPFEGDEGALVLDDSIVRGNVADFGGGIYNDGGHVELTNGSIVGDDDPADGRELGNIALQDGGGIYTVGEPPTDTLVVDGSTVTGNHAGRDGGGIYNEFDLVDIRGGSQVSGNRAGSVPGSEVTDGGNGGGIWSETGVPTEGFSGEIYSNDFSGESPGSEWSGNETSPAIVTSPSGVRYLGSAATTATVGGSGGQPWSSESVTLSLSELPEHTFLRVRFTLYVIRSWDGKSCGACPDQFDFDVAGLTGADDPQGVTSFSNVAATCQAYPGVQSGPDCFPAGTGASSTGALGYASCCGETPDSVYHLQYEFDHTDPTLDLTWLGGVGGFEEWPNEGWGIDDVEVSVPPGSGLLIDQSTVGGNTSLQCVGDCDLEGTGNGGGVFSMGHTELTGSSLVQGNLAEHEGGGIWTGLQDQPTLILEETTVTGNVSNEHGGGIYNDGDTVLIDASTISENETVDGYGGGIWTAGGSVDGAGLVATNTTISDNHAGRVRVEDGSGEGGGIYLAGTGVFELHNVTIASNTADVAGGNIAIGIQVEPGIGILDTTIVAEGLAAGAPQNCAIDEGDDIQSAGFNLSDLQGDGQATALDSCQLDSPSDLVGLDPLLDSLSNNGGPTDTRAIPGASPATDSAGAECIAVDQRGVSRPQDGNGDTLVACDRGAYERVAPGQSSAPVAPPVREQCDIIGTAQPDVLEGTDLPEVICGLGGDDRIRGGGGNDTLLGDQGDDRLAGGPGDDSLVGGPGSDTGDYSSAPGPVDASLARGTAVGVGASTDTLSQLEHLVGSPFPDVLVGDDGNNVLRGKDGGDSFNGAGGHDIIRGARGRDRGTGGDGNDTLRGGKDRDRLGGGAGNDTVSGGQERDRVKGNSQNDIVRGGGGDDTLNGNAGTDACNGGSGNNTVTNCEP